MRRLAALLIVAVLALAGCKQLEPPRSPLIPAPADAKPGGTLVVGITDPGPIAPFDAVTPAARLISRTMCDTLVTLDPVTNQVREGISDAYVTADNGRFITFRPLHSTKFTNGDTISSQDISGSLTELLAKVNASPYASLVAPFGGGVVANGPTKGPAVNDLLVDSGVRQADPAQPLNDFDVQVNANPPDGVATRIFAEPATAPIDVEAFRKDPDKFRAQPICVGPYQLTKPYTAGDSEITLERSKGYDAKNLGYTAGGKGYYDTITFKIFKDSAAVYAAYQAGTVDVAELPIDQRAKVKADAPDLQFGPYNRVEYVGFPLTSSGVWSTAPARHALAQSLDRTALAQQFGVLGKVADGFLPPALAIKAGQAGRQQAGAMTLPSCTPEQLPAKADVTAAKAALAKDGKEVTKDSLILSYNKEDDDSINKDLIKVIAKQWSSAFGTGKRSDDLFWSIYSGTTDQAYGFVGPFRESWSSAAIAPVATFNDPQVYLSAILQSGSQSNWAGYSDATFDQLVTEKLGETDDPGLRSGILAQAHERLCEQLPMVPIAFTRTAWLVRHDKVGLARDVVMGSDGLPLLRELYGKK